MAHYLLPRTGDVPVRGDADVKLFLAITTLAGSIGLLVSDWAGHAFPYL